MTRLALPWIGINVLIAVANLAFPIPVSWSGHIGGTLAGAVLTPVLLAVFGERTS